MSIANTIFVGGFLHTHHRYHDIAISKIIMGTFHGGFMCRQPHLSHDWFSSRITLEESIFSIRNHLPRLRKTDRDYHLKSLESYNDQLLHSLAELDFETTENAGNRDLRRVFELSQELSKLIMVYR